MILSRPENSSEITDDDRDLLEDAGFRDFIDWDDRRKLGAGHLGDYSMRAVMERLCWIRAYCFRLRARYREVRNRGYVESVEAENRLMRAQLARHSELVTVEDVKVLRRQLDEARAEIARNRRDMAKWQIAPRKGRG